MTNYYCKLLLIAVICFYADFAIIAQEHDMDMGAKQPLGSVSEKAYDSLAKELPEEVSTYLLITAKQNGYKFESVNQIFQSYYTNFAFANTKDAERWESFKRKVIFVKYVHEIPCKRSILNAIANPIQKKDRDTCRFVAIRILKDYKDIQEQEIVESLKRSLEYCVDNQVRNEILFALAQHDSQEGDFLVSEFFTNKSYSRILKLDLLEKLIKYMSFPVDYELLYDILLAPEIFEKENYNKVLFCINNAPNKLSQKELNAFFAKVIDRQKKIHGQICGLKSDVNKSTTKQ